MPQRSNLAQGRGVNVDTHSRGQTVEAVAAVEGGVVSGIFSSLL